MDVLKKIKAATLVETLLASALIMIIFTMASLTLNNAFRGVVKSNDASFRNRVKELSYFVENNKVEIPYFEETSQWDIEIRSVKRIAVIKGIYKPTQEELLREIEK